MSLVRLLERQAKSAKSTPPAAKNECATHHRPLEIVCVDCRLRLCSKCAIFGGHRSHDIRVEEDVASELATRSECLQEMLQLVADNEHIFSRQDEVKTAYEKCMAREKEMHTLIELRFQDYLEALKSKKAKVMQSLANVALAVGEKFSGLRDAPRDLALRVDKWKSEYYSNITRRIERTKSSSYPLGSRTPSSSTCLRASRTRARTSSTLAARF